MSVVDIRTIISSSTRRMTTGLLSSEGSKANPPGFPGETPIPSRTYSSSERGTTRRRLGEADFSERRLFQLAAVALACRGCLEYRARDLGFGQCPEHRRGVWFGGSPLLDCSPLHARQERDGLRVKMTEHLRRLRVVLGLAGQREVGSLLPGG